MVKQLPLLDVSNTPFYNDGVISKIMKISFILSNVGKQSIFIERGNNMHIRYWTNKDQYYVSSDRADYAGYYKINVNRYN